jgi:hypothetical protein
VYDLGYPKSWFTRWLVAEKPVLLHGTNHAGIVTLEPRKQSNFQGKQVEGVFASSDGIWPFFFAAIDYSNPTFRATRNGCFNLGTEKYYCFNISEEAFLNQVWTEGWIYILPNKGFVCQQPGGMWQDEWVNPAPVTPLAALQVSPDDFPFRDNVVGFRRGESVISTWRMFGRRQGASGSKFAD